MRSRRIKGVWPTASRAEGRTPLQWLDDSLWSISQDMVVSSEVNAAVGMDDATAGYGHVPTRSGGSSDDTLHGMPSSRGFHELLSMQWSCIRQPQIPRRDTYLCSAMTASVPISFINSRRPHYHSLFRSAFGFSFPALECFLLLSSLTFAASIMPLLILTALCTLLGTCRRVLTARTSPVEDHLSTSF